MNRKVCFSFAAYACTVISHLSNCNVPISRGLSDEEFQQIQARFGFDFPPDLRSILQEGLPVGAGFPNWRSSSPKQLLNMMDLPTKGLCNEVLRGAFWCQHWGKKPNCLEDAMRVAKRALRSAPVLVPIYSYCYIPCFPNLSGNPIFLIFQKDVFYCGYDLADFFGREVFVPLGSLFEGLARSAKEDDIHSHFMQLHAGCGYLRTNSMWVTKDDTVSEDSPEASAYTGFDAGDYLCENNYNPSQKQNAQQHTNGHDNVDVHRNVHRRSSKEIKWEALNKKLLAEIQNADTKHSEPMSRKSLCENPIRHAVDPPRTLVQSAGGSPRMGQSVMSRYVYFHEKTLPAEVLLQYTIAAPPWAARMARHIPVWSDLVESQESMCTAANIQATQDAFDMESGATKNSTTIMPSIACMGQDATFDMSNCGFQRNSEICTKPCNGGSHLLNAVGGSHDGQDVVQYKASQSSLDNVPIQKLFELDDRCPKQNPAMQEKQGCGKPDRKWLLPYFKNMEKTLKRGGWKQYEIEEMMSAMPLDDEWFRHTETRQGIHKVLNSSAKAIFWFLQDAGWSSPDVLEILSL